MKVTGIHKINNTVIIGTFLEEMKIAKKLIMKAGVFNVNLMIPIMTN